MFVFLPHGQAASERCMVAGACDTEVAGGDGDTQAASPGAWDLGCQLLSHPDQGALRCFVGSGS